MVNLILGLAFGAGVTFIVIHAVMAYREAQGTVWERILSTSRDSATWLWGKFLFVAGLLIEAVNQLATYLDRPEVTTFVNSYVPPRYVAGVMVAIAVITLLARLRSLVR